MTNTTKKKNVLSDLLWYSSHEQEVGVVQWHILSLVEVEKTSKGFAKKHERKQFTTMRDYPDS